MDVNGKKLYRDTDHKIIAGVCSGLGEYFNIDVAVVRIIALILNLGAGSGLIAYLVAAIIIPAKPKDNKA